MDLAGLAWTVALLHLAGHALAKAAMFLAADGVYRAAGDYTLVQRGILARSSWVFGLGALFAAMSLAAMPPQAGFVSEWYLVSDLFPGLPSQQFGKPADGGCCRSRPGAHSGDRLCDLHQSFRYRPPRSRRTATFPPVPIETSVAIGMLGIARAGAGRRHAGLADGSRTEVVSADFGSDAAARMHDGWLLVPLTAKFAFISPSKLIIAMPLLALIPIALLLLSMRRKRAFRARSGMAGANRTRHARPPRRSPSRMLCGHSIASSTAPTVETEREHAHDRKRSALFHATAGLSRMTSRRSSDLTSSRRSRRFVIAIAARLRIIQSGHLNFYLSLIGALLVGILLIALF